MSTYWIFDTDTTPQGRPLQRLLHRITSLLPRTPSEIGLARAEGYGQQISEWNAQLDASDKITVSLPEFERICAGTKEWFYNLDAHCESDEIRVRFGLHDSSALFVEAPSELGRRVAEEFSIVREGEKSGPWVPG